MKRLIERAQKLQKYLKEKRISKYNADEEKSIVLPGLLQGSKSYFGTGTG